MTEPEKRPPSLTKDIRTLYKVADWPEGHEFAVEDDDLVVLPDGSAFKGFGQVGNERRYAAQFIVAACNYFLRHLRGVEAREQAREGKGRRR